MVLTAVSYRTFRHSRALIDAVYRHSWADYELVAYARKRVARQHARYPECYGHA